MIKFNVKFPDKDAVTRSIVKAIKDQISNKLVNIECPDHHQHPEVVISGSATDPQFNIQGCCQKLIDEAVKALNDNK